MTPWHEVDPTGRPPVDGERDRWLYAVLRDTSLSPRARHVGAVLAAHLPSDGLAVSGSAPTLRQLATRTARSVTLVSRALT
jgi:hypothetical protein